MARTSVQGWAKVVDNEAFDTMVICEGGDIRYNTAEATGDDGVILRAGEHIVINRGQDCYARSMGDRPVIVVTIEYDHPGKGLGGGGGG